MAANDASADENAFEQLYLDAAKVEGKPGIYFIGPFGRRVSFASQQRRALNTVWALEKAGKIREGQDVAVIGGGLAGVTAATALAARKCSVWLYESRPRVLNVQSATMHRYVHPTVNFWPETPLDATTSFPFMDWYADICAPIMRGVCDEWFEYFKEKLTDVYTATTVAGVEINAAHGGETTVTVKANGDGPAEQRYNAVLFATGFGSERLVTGAETSSYWAEDFLPENCARQPLLISGTGDGGLIDALRCIHREFRLGQLAVVLAAMLDETSIKAKLMDGERKVQEAAGKGNDVKAAELYVAMFEDLLSKMTGECRSFLDQSLVKRNPPLRLVGLLPSPYSLNAAPVHKLMIAHAIKAGAIIYEKGQLIDGPVLRVEGAPDEDLTGTMCIARHGAEPPLDHILQPFEIEQLKSNQRLLADLLSARPYDDSYWANWKHYPTRDPDAVEFARFRLPLAAGHMMKDYKLRLALGLSEQSPVYVIGVDKGGSTPSGGFPSSLFGVRTVIRPAEVIDAYAS